MWIVKHKNPDDINTKGGKEWVEDGPFLTKPEAELWVDKCRYRINLIPYEVEEFVIIGSSSSPLHTEEELQILGAKPVHKAKDKTLMKKDKDELD